MKISISNTFNLFLVLYIQKYIDYSISVTRERVIVFLYIICDDPVCDVSYVVFSTYYIEFVIKLNTNTLLQFSHKNRLRILFKL